MAYEDQKIRHEIKGLVRMQDHNKADLIAPGAAYAVTEPTKPRSLMNMFRRATEQELCEIFTTAVFPCDTTKETEELLIEPEKAIVIMHQGQGGVLNSKNPDFHAHVFDRTKALDHIVSKRTFVPRPNFDLQYYLNVFADSASNYDRDGFVLLDMSSMPVAEAKKHQVMVYSGSLSEFFLYASADQVQNFRSNFIQNLKDTGEDNDGQVRVVIEHDRYINFLSGENLAQEGNKRWFEDIGQP